MARLTKENADLRAQIAAPVSKPTTAVASDTFEDVAQLLASEYLKYQEDRESVLDWFYRARTTLVSGVENTYNMSEYANFLFFRVAPLLQVHGLVEDTKVTGARWRRVKTTKRGNDFLVFLQKRIAAEKSAIEQPNPTASATAEATQPPAALAPAKKPRTVKK